MTHYYLRAMVGHRILRTEEIRRDTIQDAQRYAGQGFLANIRYEGFGVENLKVDILHKPIPDDPRWSPSCRAHHRGKVLGWVWSYPPDE